MSSLILSLTLFSVRGGQLQQTDRNEDGAAGRDLRGIGDNADGRWAPGVQAAHAQLVRVRVRLHAEHPRYHGAAGLHASGDLSGVLSAAASMARAGRTPRRTPP